MCIRDSLCSSCGLVFSHGLLLPDNPRPFFEEDDTIPFVHVAPLIANQSKAVSVRSLIRQYGLALRLQRKVIWSLLRNDSLNSIFESMNSRPSFIAASFLTFHYPDLSSELSTLSNEKSILLLRATSYLDVTFD